MEYHRSDELMSLWVDGSILPHVLVNEVGLNNSNLYDEELSIWTYNAMMMAVLHSCS